MSIINSAPNRQPMLDVGLIADQNLRALLTDASRGGVPREWANFFTQVFRVCAAVAQSGPTAERPTADLFPGRPYFDTSLGAAGKPIWVNKTATGWVLADGTAA